MDKDISKNLKELEKALEKQKNFSLDMQKAKGDQKKMEAIMKQVEQMMKAQNDAQKAILKQMRG